MDFSPVDDIKKDNVRVVYQGVEGAYAHAAVLEYFGEDVDNYHVRSWEEAMMELDAGSADYAVLPIENSSEGVVADIYDLLVEHDNVIAAEIFIPVQHALLGLPGAKLKDIKVVYSHPQALSQCSRYLNERPEWKQISVENTAVAAKKVIDEQDIRQAAVASLTAGKLYGLDVLAVPINYNPDNTTRFIILTNRRIYRRDAGKICICFELPDKTGSLYHMLGYFNDNDVNMIMIESRPIPGKSWEYRFFVDLEGNLGDDNIKKALTGVHDNAENFWILGNY